MRGVGLVLCGVFAGVGVTLAVWQLMPARWLSAGRAQPEPSPSSRLDLPPFSENVNPTLETRVNVEEAPAVASEIARRVRLGVEGNASLSGLGADKIGKLLAATEEVSAVYLTGDHRRWAEFLRRTGARILDIDNADSDESRSKAAAIIRRHWEATAKDIALNPVSLEGVRVSLRYLDGKRLTTQDELHATMKTFFPERWPTVSGDPARNALTVVEVRWPVFFFRPPAGESPGASGPVSFAVWFVWDGGAKDWRIQQLRIYNPLRLNVMSVPMY